VLVGAITDRLSYGAGFVVGGVGALLGLLVLALVEARRATPARALVS